MTAASIQRLEWIALPAAVTVAAVSLSSADANASPMLVGLSIAALVAWIAWQDLKTFTISDAAVVALAVLAVTARWPQAVADEGAMRASALLATDALLPGGLLLAFREIYYRRKGHDGLGLGDVKLAAAGGLLVGVIGFSWALFTASLVGLLLVGLGRRLTTGRTLVATDRLAFGAILAPALFAVWIAGQTQVLQMQVLLPASAS